MTERVLGPAASSQRRHRLSLLIGLMAALALAGLISIGFAGAANQGGFEIDASNSAGALYSGTLGGDDWAKGSANNGVFSNTGTTLATPGGNDCYLSDVFVGDAAGQSAFICDGNSDAKLKDFPEQNIVSPSGKTPDDQWPVKPGQVRPKNDFSHAYVYTKSADSPCDTDTIADDTILYLGGHVGDNEGDHFWGFEFDRTAPGGFSSLKANNGSSFTLDFNRQVGDFLVSFTVPGNTSDPVVIEVHRVTGFNANGSAIFTLAGTGSGCPQGSQGLTELSTNSSNDAKAPPWNVPVCDPTADNSANQCRLANGTTASEDLLAPRDFAEASVDLTAFGIEPCVSNIIFTSRSAHVLEGADVQDVGGADFPLCGGKSGLKFEDKNGNGTKDTDDPTISGWTINLYKDANGDKILQDADDGTADSTITAFRTTTTDATGNYSFPLLPSGNYIVCEKAQPTGGSGWFESFPSSGTTNAADCVPTATIPKDTSLARWGHAFQVLGGESHTGNNFGNFKKATIAGTKFKDKNANGTKDSDDGGLGTWVIKVYDDSGGTAGSLDATDALVDTQTTAANGTYTSAALAPGTYFVCEVAKADWQQTYPTASTTDSISCAAKDGGRGWKVTLLSQTNATVKDFGNTPESHITITFVPEATLPGGGAATRATLIDCGTTGGSVANNNSFTSNTVLTSNSPLTCTITFVDP